MRTRCKDQKSGQKAAFSYARQLPSIIAIVGPEADSLRVAVQLQNVQAGTITIGGVDEPTIVDFEVVRHVAVRSNGVGVRYRDVEPHLDRRLRLADVPRANTAGEGSNESQLAVKGIAEVLLARVRPEARSPRAVVSTRIFFARARIDCPRREDHRALPRIWLMTQARCRGF